MTEATIDYAAVTPEDLDIKREPRKSKFALVHKPTGRVAPDPVVPGSFTEARFRRHTGIPKENRVKDMIGYIESRAEDDSNFYPIIGGENPRNDYLVALANDPAALKACFDGPPQVGDNAPSDPPEAAITQAAPTETPVAESPPPSPSGEVQELEADSTAPPGAAEDATVAAATPPPPAPNPEPTPESSGEPVNPDEITALDELLAGLKTD